MSSTAGEGGTSDRTEPPPSVDRGRRWLAVGFGIVVLAAAAIAIYRDRTTVSATLTRIGAAGALISVAVGLIGTAATGPVWRQVLVGLGVRLKPRDAMRVYFTSQLGKYVPGAVWPILLQVEAGRSRRASRRTMLTAGVLSMVIGICSGLLLACALLPFSGTGALHRYWPVLLAIPALLVVMHPRALPAVIDRVMRLLRRPPINDRLDGRREMEAIGWSLLSWVGLGTQLYVLCAAVGRSGPSVWLLCVGAMAFAVPLGILFIPAPAGAGVREAALTLMLSASLDPGQALAVVVASRALLVVCDVLMAGVASLLGSVGRTPRQTDPAQACDRAGAVVRPQRRSEGTGTGSMS